VVGSGLHVVIQQDQMRDIRFVRPDAQSGPYRVLGRGSVHGSERTRRSERVGLTTGDVS
jgi:hypothetical protein